MIDTKDKEIKRLKEEYVMLQNASDEVEEEKDREIERLHSIIKEVRELLQKANIYRNYDDDEDDTWYTDLNIDKALEILDKENK